MIVFPPASSKGLSPVQEHSGSDKRKNLIQRLFMCAPACLSFFKYQTEQTEQAEREALLAESADSSGIPTLQSLQNDDIEPRAGELVELSRGSTPDAFSNLLNKIFTSDMSEANEISRSILVQAIKQDSKVFQALVSCENEDVKKTAFYLLGFDQNSLKYKVYEVFFSCTTGKNEEFQSKKNELIGIFTQHVEKESDLLKLRRSTLDSIGEYILLSEEQQKLLLEAFDAIIVNRFVSQNINLHILPSKYYKMSKSEFNFSIPIQIILGKLKKGEELALEDRWVESANKKRCELGLPESFKNNTDFLKELQRSLESIESENPSIKDNIDKFKTKIESKIEEIECSGTTDTHLYQSELI